MPTHPLRILVPVDFSDASRRALAVAAVWARRVGGELHLAHVVERPGELLLRAEVELAEMIPPQDAAVAERHVAIGEPSTAIADLAGRFGIDLIVIGTRGRGGAARLFLGSVAADVVRRAPCPVVCVPPGAAIPAARGQDSAVCAVDFSDPSRRALEMTARLAPRLGLAIQLLHVIEEARVEDREAADRWLVTWCADASAVGADVGTTLTIGDPAAEIVREAGDRELIAIATHGRTGFTRLALGSVAEKVITNAPCPVLTIGPACVVP